MSLTGEALRGYLDYLRDLGVYDLYRQGEPDDALRLQAQEVMRTAVPEASNGPAPKERISVVSVPRPQAVIPSPAIRPTSPVSMRPRSGPEIVIAPPSTVQARPLELVDAETFDDTFSADSGPFAPPSMPLISFNQLAPLPAVPLAASAKAAALLALREHIGDCTRCPLAYAGRHTIVFADGDPAADLMFVGEGPGADEDATGVPFVGKAGQLLNNMIGAMGLTRESVYIANIVKCRPPKNRVPEPIEANTCSQFLLQQIDIVQPKVIVALGSTAATYLLGVKQSLTNLRGQWHDVRGAKCAVTYHPAFLLRDPRQKGEAWKDLQRVMVELNLKPPTRS